MPQNAHLALEGEKAIITGAGRGIGRSIALAFAEAGADVGIAARTESDLEQLVADIQAMGRHCLAVQCDVTNPEQVNYMVTTLLAGLGSVDILVNNAGSAGSHKFLDHPDDLWHRMLAANLTSVYYVCKALVPHLIERRSGRIITIASIASRVGGRYMAAYAASKHGVLGLTRALATEMLPYNVTVNAICPGYVDTPMTDGTIRNISAFTGMSEAQARETLAKTSPQDRLIEPEEVAAIALFLAQDSSKGITGQAINVDGGSIMS